MKCPKCGYLGFEDVERCRNCGYDFSLSSVVPIPDLTFRRDTKAITAYDDLSLIDGGSAAPDGRMTDIGADLDRTFGAESEVLRPAAPAPAVGPSVGPSMARPQASAATAAAPARVELPLFGPPIPDDEPLITRASPPRAPLAVRRATPEVAKVRAEQSRTPSFDLQLEDAPPPPITPQERAKDGVWTRGESDETHDAAVGARFVAVVIDLLILAAIDVVVIYFTMQICGISPAELDILPKGPLLAFLFVQNGGYLVAFTAGGQTLGKMAAGIRVVPAESSATLDLGRAFLRTLMWVLLAVPAGLGFITAVISRDHRGLHDRFAGTRVVSV